MKMVGAKMRKGVTLFEILLSIVLLAAVSTGFLSVLISVKKKSKYLTDNKVIMKYEAKGISAQELVKLRLIATSSVGTIRHIGTNISTPANSISSIEQVYRMRPDLNGDNMPDKAAPVFIFLKLEEK